MRGKVILIAGAVALAVAGFVGVRLLSPGTTLIRGSTADFTVTDDDAAPSAPSPRAESWPEYGFNNQKTRENPTLRKLGLPGRKLWEFDAGSLVEFPPVIDRGVAVVGTNLRRVFALDLRSGAIVWQARTRGQIATSPAIARGVAYVATTTGDLEARRLTDGRLLWSRRIGKSSESSPTIVGDAIYVGTLDGVALRIDTRGREVWRARVPGPVKSALAVAHDTVVVADYAGHVTALRQSDGGVVWQTASPGGALRGHGRFYAGPTVRYGRVYLGNVNGKILALDVTDGSVKWLRTAGDWVYSSAAVAEKLVIVGSFDHRLYALDAATGDIRWTFDAGERISGSASVIGSTVYVSTLNRNRRTGRTYGLDLRTGRRVWSFPDGRYSPAVAVRSTILIVGRRSIYAFAPR